MNATVEFLNGLADLAFSRAWSMLWQSSILIAMVWVVDFALRGRLRAGVRYALWAVVLLKLVLPPALALPTGLAWWVRPTATHAHSAVLVRYGSPTAPAPAPGVATVQFASVPPELSGGVWMLALAGLITFAMVGWMTLKWRQLAVELRGGLPAPDWLNQLLFEVASEARVGRAPHLRLLKKPVSPAIFGLLRPVILLPETLVDTFSRDQIRGVLLHEIVHLRRGDIWMNCAQALLQAMYWWHPLVWLANHRMRRLREEAVDDAVMLELRGDGQGYAATLLQVGRLVLKPQPAMLGFMGILESRTALRARIERLVELRPPRRSRLTIMSFLCVAAFGAVALPMGNAPTPAAQTQFVSASDTSDWLEREGKTRATQAGTAGADEKLLLRSIVVDTNKFSAEPGESMLELLKAHLKKLGVNLDPPKSIVYTESIHWLMVRATAADLDVIEHTIGVLSPATLVADAKLLYEMGKLKDAETKLEQALQQDPGNASALYYLNLVRDSRRNRQAPRGRQRIFGLLERTRLERAAFDRTPLREVAAALSAETKRADPEHEGVQFIIRHEQESNPDPARSPGGVLINFPSPLENASVVEVLEAVVKVAETPLKYSIEDYGVVFSFKTADAQALYVRMIKVDPPTLETNLRSAMTGNGRGNDGLLSLLREYLGRMRVDLSPPKTIFYNERDGSVLVRATLRDLEQVETALTVLQAAPAQVNLKARFIEISEAEAQRFWARYPRSGPAKESHEPNAHAVWSAILSSDRASAELKTWKAAGATVLAEPSVTTLSGRQAEVLVGEPMKIMVYTNSPSAGWETNEIMAGVSLKVFPIALGTSIQLSLNTSTKEFLGYENEGDSDHAIPRIRSREFSCDHSVPDGTTLVLGGDLNQAQTARSGSEQKQLLVLITPTLIDPAGNRLHPEGRAPQPKKASGVLEPVRAWHPTIPPRPVKE